MRYVNQKLFSEYLNNSLTIRRYSRTQRISAEPIEQIRKDIGRDIIIPTPETFDPDTYTPYQGEPTGLVADGDVIDLGNRKLIIYHTPGHSPGHICIFYNTNGYSFSGNLLFYDTPIYEFYHSTNPDDLINSFEILKVII